MNGFDKRLIKGRELENYLLNYLKDNNIEYVITGYENQPCSPNAMKLLHSIKDDETTSFIRYYPDILAIVKNKTGKQVSCFIEVKNSSGIEYECYNSYKVLRERLGVRILLFLRNKKICLFDDLVFKEMSDYDNIAKMKVPVIEGIWKVPRDMDSDSYYKYLKAYSDLNKYTSGCSFAYIDFDNIKLYDLTILGGKN